jgi:hypothetical protein
VKEGFLPPPVLSSAGYREVLRDRMEIELFP